MTRRSGRRPPGTPRALRMVLPIVATVATVATVAIVAPLAWLWQDSRLPGVYSVMDMGTWITAWGLWLIAVAGTADICRARCPATTC
jgi:hypothetical protein